MVGPDFHHPAAPGYQGGCDPLAKSHWVALPPGGEPSRKRRCRPSFLHAQESRAPQVPAAPPHRSRHSSEPSSPYPWRSDKSDGISRQLEVAEPPEPRPPLPLKVGVTKCDAYRDLRAPYARAPPSQTDDIESTIDASCDTGYLSSWRSDSATYLAPRGAE